MPNSTKKTDPTAALQEKLHRSGFKWTQPRRQVVEALVRSQEHLSIEELHRELTLGSQPPAMATVYRTVRLLESLGLLAKVDLGDGVDRYEWIHSAHRHHHLLCKKCFSVEEVHEDLLTELEKEIAESYGFTVEGHEVTFTGVCRACQSKE